MVRNGPRLRRLRHLTCQAGYTLIETLVVMTLLVVVIGAIADGFTNASKTETDQTARADDQEAARQALERMRRDIHCSSAAIAKQTDPSDATKGWTLNLTVNPGQCLAVTAGLGGGVAVNGVDSDGVQWCTVPVGAATNRYILYRTIVHACDAADAVFQVDHLTRGDVWAPKVLCSAAHLESVPVDMAVNRDIDTRPDRTYELTDRIALRNDTPDTGAQACG
jgi:prepilin-type N-terminal cleavage/methylation domain-containing protein